MTALIVIYGIYFMVQYWRLKSNYKGISWLNGPAYEYDPTEN